MPSQPLYCIRTDAVLIHPALPGFPITGAPTIAALPDSPTANFVVAWALAPISWPTILGLYSISQPRRAHIWPLRALLHLYLMVSLPHLLSGEPGRSLETLTYDRDQNYQQLMDQGTHYIGNFWVRTPELLLLALRRVKEGNIPNVLRALVSTALHADATHNTTIAHSLADQMLILVGQIQTHVTNDTLSAPDIELTRRRAGIIERALHVAIQHASPGLRALSPTARALVPSLTADNKVVASQKVIIVTTLGPAFDSLTTQPHQTQA